MSDEAQYKQNIERWAIFQPQPARELDKPYQRVFPYTNANGTANLQTVINGETQYFHSLDSPEEEAKAWFSQLNLSDIQALFVFGVGLGYYYDAAKEWLALGPDQYLIFVETDLEVLQHLFRTDRGTEMLANRQVWIAFSDEQGSIMEALAAFFLLKHDICSALKLYEQTYPSELHRMKSRLAFHLQRKKGIASEYRIGGKIFFSNFFRNLLLLPTSYPASSLFDKFTGIPAIICGAGPSLAKNLEVLKTLRDRALIFAGGTAMNALNTIGLLPHFGVGIDPNTAQYTRLIMNIAYELPFFYRNRMNYTALNLVQGERLFSTGSGGHETAHWFEEKLGIAGKELNEGYNVIGFSLAIAEALGCYPIILVGLDLAYSNDLPYCPGIVNHPLHQRKDFFRTKTIEDELVSHTDINGKPVSTLWKWIAEATWFSQFSKRHREAVIINSTEGGLGFDGVPNKPLQDVFDSILKKQYDFGAMIHGEIHNSPMPPYVTYEAIVELMEELTNSLIRCIGFCNSVVNDIQATLDGLDAGQLPEKYLLTPQGQQALEDLETEDGYKHVLKDFLTMQVEIQSRELKRIEMDKGILTEIEIALRRGVLTKARYSALVGVSEDNIRLIQTVLAEHALLLISMDTTHHSPAKPSQCPTEHSLPDSILEEDYYPNGHVKMRKYRKEGKLNGSSTFFSPEGRILVSNFFLDGLQQGKTFTYYLDGSLASEQSFQDGQWHDQQKYYYNNGVLKTLLHYDKGLLNGEVALFYPNGSTKRTLNFVQGKRKGLDRIWNEEGVLIIEAEFDNDKAFGVAKQWYKYGMLAKQITFDKDSPSVWIQQWTPDGRTLDSEGIEESDYFNEIAKGTGRLTTDLEKLLHEVSLPATHLPEEITRLNQELEHLKELQRQLMSQSGLDPSNQEESLWKSRSHQKEAQRQVMHMTSRLQEQMRVLSHTLTRTLEKLSKRNRDAEKEKEDTQNESKEI